MTKRYYTTCDICKTKDAEDYFEIHWTISNLVAGRKLAPEQHDRHMCTECRLALIRAVQAWREDRKEPNRD